jgi:hypothetical protein
MIQAKQPSRGLRGGNLGAIPKADVDRVFKSQDLDKKFGAYEGTFKDQLTFHFTHKFGGTIANRAYVFIKGTVSRLGPGAAFGTTGTTYAANTQVTVTASAGNWAQIGTSEWVPVDVLSMNLVTNEAITAKLIELIPAGVQHALSVLNANPGAYLTVNGVTYTAIRSLEEIAATYIITNTASSLGF